MYRTPMQFWRWGEKKQMKLHSAIRIFNDKTGDLYNPISNPDPFIARRREDKIRCDLATKIENGVEIVKARDGGPSLYEMPNSFFSKKSNWFRLPKGTALPDGFCTYKDRPFHQPDHHALAAAIDMPLTQYMKGLEEINASWIMDNTPKDSTPSGYGESEQNPNYPGLNKMELLAVAAIQDDIREFLVRLESASSDEKEDLYSDIAMFRQALSEFERVGREKLSIFRVSLNSYEISKPHVRPFSTSVIEMLPLTRSTYLRAIACLEKRFKHFDQLIETNEEREEDWFTEYTESGEAAHYFKQLVK